VLAQVFQRAEGHDEVASVPKDTTRSNDASADGGDRASPVRTRRFARRQASRARAAVGGQRGGPLR
jgi:hypothetical protein